MAVWFGVASGVIATSDGSNLSPDPADPRSSWRLGGLAVQRVAAPRTADRANAKCDCPGNCPEWLVARCLQPWGESFMLHAILKAEYRLLIWLPAAMPSGSMHAAACPTHAFAQVI